MTRSAWTCLPEEGEGNQSAAYCFLMWDSMEEGGGGGGGGGGAVAAMAAVGKSVGKLVLGTAPNQKCRTFFQAASSEEREDDIDDDDDDNDVDDGDVDDEEAEAEAEAEDEGGAEDEEEEDKEEEDEKEEEEEEEEDEEDEEEEEVREAIPGKLITRYPGTTYPVTCINMYVCTHIHVYILHECICVQY